MENYEEGPRYKKVEIISYENDIKRNNKVIKDKVEFISFISFVAIGATVATYCVSRYLGAGNAISHFATAVLTGAWGIQTGKAISEMMPAIRDKAIAKEEIERINEEEKEANVMHK